MPIWADEVAALSPSSWWKVNESAGFTADDAMNAFDGTYDSSISYSNPSLVAYDAGTCINLERDVGHGIAFGDVYNMLGTTSFTAIMWGTLEAFDNINGHYIWGNNDGAAKGWGLSLEDWFNPDLRIQARRGDDAGFDTVDFTLLRSSVIGSTHMYGICYDGTNLKVIFDGLFAASGVSSKSVTAATVNTAFVFGRFSGGGSGWDGFADELVLWDGTALTEAQLIKLYTAGHITPSIRNSDLTTFPKHVLRKAA